MASSQPPHDKLTSRGGPTFMAYLVSEGEATASTGGTWQARRQYSQDSGAHILSAPSTFLKSPQQINIYLLIHNYMYNLHMIIQI